MLQLHQQSLVSWQNSVPYSTVAIQEDHQISAAGGVSSSRSAAASSARSSSLQLMPAASGSNAGAIPSQAGVIRAADAGAAAAAGMRTTATSSTASLHSTPGSSSGAASSSAASNMPGSAPVPNAGAGLRHALPGCGASQWLRQPAADGGARKAAAPRLQVPTLQEVDAVPLPVLPPLLDLCHEPAKVLQARLVRVWSILGVAPPQQMAMVLR